MSDNTKIQWADATWNPITGCTKVSQGCKNCYAAELHDRRHKAFLRGAKLPEQYAKPFNQIQLHPERLEMPLHWKKPRRIFVNSTSDLFHPDVPDYFIGMVFAVAALTPHHTYMILTKRPDRMVKIFERSSGEFWGTVRVNLLRRGYPLSDDERAIFPLPNVWLGVSVENQAAAYERIPALLQTPAAVRFVSCEPLLGPIDIHDDLYPCKVHCSDDIPALDWVIVGGESGPGARPMHPDWARSLRDQCQAAGVSFFFKQWGEWLPYELATPEQKAAPGIMRSSLAGDGKSGDVGAWLKIGKSKAGRLFDGVEWNEYPEVRA